MSPHSQDTISNRSESPTMVRKQTCTQQSRRGIYQRNMESWRGGSAACRRKGTLMKRTGVCFFFLFSRSLLVPQPSDGLAAPPHLRVCPGPLDDGNAALCGIPGNVSFVNAEQNVRLSAGQVLINVARTGGFLGNGLVAYETVNSTARAGLEFVTAEGQLSWATRDGQDRVIVVYLIDSGEYRAGTYITSFNVRIYDPTGIGLGSIVETEITILNTNAETGQLDVPTTDVVVNEQAGSVTVNVTRTGGTDCNATVQYRTVAIPGSDYGHYGLNTGSQTGTLEWLEGDGTPRSITIPIRDNSELQNEPGEQFFIELHESNCARLGNERVRVTVTDDDQVGVLRVVTPTVSVRSDDSTAVVTLSRVNGAATPVSVDFFTTAGTAVEGVDFTATSGTLIWQHAESGDKTVSIPIFDVIGNGLLEKELTLHFAYLTGIDVEGGTYTATVTIVNTFANPGRVVFANVLPCTGPSAPAEGNCYYVFERENQTSIEVIRTGNSVGDVAVTYTVSNVSAGAQNDFVATSGTLSWGTGDKSSRFITIQISQDPQSQPILEFIQVQLANADPLVRVVEGNNSLVYVGIMDDDGGGVITVEAEQALVDESDLAASFVIKRTGSSVGPATATWRTVDGNALAGIDYVKGGDTVSWTDGDSSSRTVTIDLIDDGASRLGLQFKHFFVSVTASAATTFADPRAETAAVFIADDGARTGFLLFPEVEFDELTSTLSPPRAGYVVDEGAGTIEIVVMRKEGFEGNVSIEYHTRDGTATDGEEYSGVSGTLSWAEGDFSNRSVVVAIVDDASFSATAASKTFVLVLSGFELSGGGGYRTGFYRGPAEVEAEVAIVENDGGGVLSFVEEEVAVDEDAGTVTLWVKREGGSNFNVSVSYHTQADTATAPLLRLEGGSFAAVSLPTSCAAATQSGPWMVQGAGGVVREVYCYVNGSSGVASASLFHWDLSTLLWERECALVGGNAASDSSALWTDLAARVSASPLDQTAGTAFASVQKGPEVAPPAALAQRPEGVGGRARPVPFPLNNKTVWFDWEHGRVVWENATWGRGVGNVSFADVGIDGTGGMEDSANDFYFIVDGIAECHVGARSKLQNGFSAVLLSFAWEQGSVSWRSVGGLELPSNASWCPNAGDAFGHLLWTVNGRVLYRNCSGLEDGVLRVVLGGGIDEPMAAAEGFALRQCAEEEFEECGGWVLAGQRNATGLDLLSHVDAAGFVYLGDRGPGGGLLGCGDGDHYGSVRSGIELGRQVVNDYAPVAGRLEWAAGETGRKAVHLEIAADGVADARVRERLRVELSGAVGATVGAEGGSVEVVIADLDGAGQVQAEVNESSPVGERERCCVNCGSSFALFQQRWCTDFLVRRSGGRGAVCVDYALVGAGGNRTLTAEPGVHFESQNGTLCWDNGEVAPKIVTAELPYHQPYDMMHKTLALELSASSNFQGSSYQANSGIEVGAAVRQTIEDEDMEVGFFTFRASTLTGMSVFAYNDQEPSALLIVERVGGTDLDVEVVVETAELPAGTNTSLADTRISVQVPVAVQDGSRGTNSFCISNDYMVAGACVDSSSALSCADNACAAIVAVEASPAAAGATFSDANAEYLGLSRKLRWAEGDDGLRGLTIPLFYGSGATAQNTSASYRFFVVRLRSARVSSGGVELASSAPLEALIPSANAVSECSAAGCTLQGDEVVLSECSALSCRDSASSEALVAIPSVAGSGTIRMVNTTYFVPESMPAAGVVFPVKRFGGAAGVVSVEYRTVPVAVENVSVPAIPMTEFMNVSGVLQWSNGDRSDKQIVVPITDDNAYVRGRIRKSFVVELFNAQGGAALSAESSEAIVIIVDDDADTGVIQMHETRRRVSENATIATLEVARIGGSDLDVYVRFHTGLLTQWSTPTEQTGNATAHSQFLAEQSYACQTTLDGSPSASVSTDLRGGGGPALAFDLDPATFWDASNSVSRSEYLLYDFRRCRLLGAKVTGYTFSTRPPSADSGCPAEWSFQGSMDGFSWATLDSRGGISCSPNGQAYTLSTGDPAFYQVYRWVFTRDAQGFVGIRLNEVVLDFEDAGVASSNLLQKEVCNEEGVCCRFGSADCDGWSGSSYEHLRDASYDFEFASGVLRWDEGDTSLKLIEVELVDDCMGCSEATCGGSDQLQDRPLEEFSLQLSIPSDREIRELTGDESSIFPFRKDAAINGNLSTATMVVLDDDGPGVLELRVLSCGQPKGGTAVVGFTSAAGVVIADLDAGCPVLESAGTVDFLVSRVGGSRGSISVNYTVAGITAVDGVDFAATRGTLVWSDGDADGQKFSMRVTDDDGFASGGFNRTVLARLDGVVLGDGTENTEGGAQLSECSREIEEVCVEPALNNIEITIIDKDAAPGTVAVDRADLDIASQYEGRQDVGEVNVTVTRSGGTDLPLEVSYETVQISSSEARPCTDGVQSNCEYLPVAGKLRWADGESGTRTITVTISQSDMRRNFERFILRISGSVNSTVGFCGGYTTSVIDGVLLEGRVFESVVCGASFASEAYVTLIPRTTTGFFELTTSSWPLVVPSDVGNAIIVISRVGGADGIVSAQLQSVGAAEGHSAIEEINFISEIETKSWYDGESGPRLFLVPVLSGSVPPDTLVTMYVKIIFFSSNSGVNEEKDDVRVDIRSDQYTHKFLQKSVSESSLVQLEENTITVVFQTNGVLGPGGTVVISGMINSRTSDNPALPVTGTGAEVFGGTGAWLESGSLTLTVVDGQLFDYQQVMTLSFTITNGRNEQSPRLLQIEVSGDPGCAEPIVLGSAVACPEAMGIPKEDGEMDGVILSYSVLALASSVDSKLCNFAECPHSPLTGAYNFVSVAVQTPVPFSAGSQIKLFGMEEAADMALEDRALPLLVSNLLSTQPAERKSATELCVCYSVGCTCEAGFSGVLPNNVTLRARLQCNSLGWGALGGELITVQVGADQVYSSAPGGGLATPPYACEDACEVEHELFSPIQDITSFVSATGEVYIAIESTSNVDFCGKGEFLRVNLTVEWDRIGADRVDLIGNFSQETGELSLVVPSGYEFSNLFDITVLFPLRNPLSAFAGASLSVQVSSGDESTVIGPDTVAGGSVLLTERAAAIASTEIGEATPVQGEENLIIIQFSFNSELGGSRDGVSVTIAGLTGSNTPDTDALEIRSCTICRFPADTYLDLSTLAPTANWDQASGELSFLLRGTAPDYKIERQNIVGMIALRNADSTQAGANPVLKVSGEVVRGANVIPDVQMTFSGERAVLTAFVSMDIFSGSQFAYNSGSGYTAVDRITISFVSGRELMYLDSIIFTVPSLTTCEVLCYGGSCRDQGCADIQGFYIDALPQSSISGNESNFFLMSWNEAQSQIRLTASGGRALCAGSSFAVSFSPLDYGCEEYGCSLKVLPDDIGASRGENLFFTDALGCENGGPYCSPPAASSFVNNPVALQQGSYWGQGPARIDVPNMTEAVGRAGFSVQVHAGLLFVLGGIGPSGFVTDVRSSADGLSFDRAGDEPVVFGKRMLMPSVSFRGNLWVLGGRDGESGAGLNDVWKSEEGDVWCQVTSAAAWAGREQHAAIVHNGNMWVLGGLSDIGGADVWYSGDGGVWTVATWSAAFGSRSGAAAASFRERMWVYGGGAVADVWQSSDGVAWEQEPTAPWENRRLQGGLIYDSKIWVVGGYSNQSFTDVWYSEDGAEWVRATAQAQWGGRFGASAVAFSNRLWVLGGSATACDGAGISTCAGAANGTGCEGFFLNCSGNDVWLDSYVALTFVELELSVSSTVRSADNTLRLEFVVDNDVVQGQQVTVSPLESDMADGNIAVFGPSARVVGKAAAWNKAAKTLTLTFAESLLAGSRLSIAWTIVNSAERVMPTRVVVAAEGTSDQFARLSGSTWAVVGGVDAAGAHMVSTAKEEPQAAVVVDGGVMFDVTAIQSVVLGGMTIGLQPQAVQALAEQQVVVYYKEGSHVSAMHNLSEWRVLGSVAVDADEGEANFEFEFGDLKSFITENDAPVTTSRCAALNHQCEGETVCNFEQCMCQAGIDMLLPQNRFVDTFPYEYLPSEFSQGTTYCAYDNVNSSDSCVNTDGDVFDCAPSIVQQQRWLGPQPTWAENTSEYMSSTLVRNVNITQVLTQSTEGMWHSGVGNRFDAEADCPHLPFCPDEWGLNKNQWLAFDMGVCHSLSGFRTSFPNYTLVPEYYFLGVQRLNIREEYWRLAHFQNFEFQYSATGLDGPWITAIKGVADIQEEGYQEFYFEPATARYWRLLMIDNYGFGYIALQAIEMFGFESVWCHQSSWCDQSPLCDSAAADRTFPQWDRDQSIRAPFGLALEAGKHSFFVRSSFALNMSVTTEHRASVLQSDGRLAIHRGSPAEYHTPLFAYQAPATKPQHYATTSSASLTNAELNDEDGFVLVARFRTARGSNDGTLLTLGEGCAGGLRVEVRGMAIRLVQGCPGAGGEAQGPALNVSEETDYCFVASYAPNRAAHWASNASLQLRLERSFPLAASNPEAAVDSSVNISAVPPFSSVVVGASESCGAGAFPGAVTGAAVYAGVLDPGAIAAACSRKCPAVLPDGRCTERVDLAEENSVETRGAADWEYWRLRVTSYSNPANVSQWCLREMSFFSSPQPNWIPIVVVPSQAQANSEFPGRGASGAFDGNVTATGMSPSDGEYCTSVGDDEGWLEYAFDDLVCVTGYAMHGPKAVTEDGVPSSWTLQGSVDGENWKLVDSQVDQTWQRGEWKRFDVKLATDFLFVSNLFDETSMYGYNTLSTLYGWIGADDGWVVEQEIPTRGARSATHFTIGNDHFLAIANMIDGSVESAVTNNGQRATNAQVGSDLYQWSDTGFVPVETLPTHNSAGLTYVNVNGRDLLISADKRMVAYGDQGLEYETSIVFEREQSTEDECSNSQCSETGTCGCMHCACYTLLESEATSAGILTVDHEPGAAWDGDLETVWSAQFNTSGYRLAAVLNVSDTALMTEALGLAMQLEFATCLTGAMVKYYTIVTTQSNCPFGWELQGGIDGEDWVVLDTRTEQGCSGVRGGQRQPKTFTVDDPQRYAKYRFVFGLETNLSTAVINGTLDAGNTTVEIADIAFVFENQDNLALLEDVRGNGTVRSYDFEPRGAPFVNVYRDTDGFPVPAFRYTESPVDGAYGPFDIELLDGSLVQGSGCGVGGNDANSSWWNEPLAPWRSCVSAADLCTPSDQGVCFDGNTSGICLAGNNSGVSCKSDAECGDRGTCAPQTRYSYKITFKYAVRLITLRMRGCGWCSGTVDVLDATGTLLSRRSHTEVTNCSSCNAWSLRVNRIGREFTITEASFAPSLVRSAISLEWEPTSGWQEVQLIRTQGASDVEPYAVGPDWFIAIANFRETQSCYGDFGCTNPIGAAPLVDDANLPYNINSQILWYNGQEFVVVQDIASLGALDFEFFVISGQQYLALANSFDATTSSASVDSIVYKLVLNEAVPCNVSISNCTNGTDLPGHEWIPFQHVPTVDARTFTYFQKDGRHLLALASGAESMSSLYLWNGRRFDKLAQISDRSATDVEVFDIDGTTYFAVATTVEAESLTVNSPILRWADAVEFHGAISFTDAYSPSAQFPVRTINSTSTIADDMTNMTVTFAADRMLPVGTLISISGLTGSNTVDGRLDVQGPSSFKFGDTAQWFGEDSCVVFNVSSAVVGQELVTVHFFLRNGFRVQPARRATISCSGAVVALPKTMEGRVLAVDTLPVLDVTLLSVSESSAFAEALNNDITVSFRANFDLVPGIELRVLGLTGLASRSDYLSVAYDTPFISLFGESADRFGIESTNVSAVARWDQSTGEISADVLRFVPARSTVTWSVTVTNGDTAQSPVNVEVSLVNVSNSSVMASTGPSDDSILGFASTPVTEVATITEAHTRKGVSNRLYITLRPSVPLVEGQTISINGIANTPNGDGQYALGGSHARLFRGSLATFLAGSDRLIVTVGPSCSAVCADGDCLVSSAPCAFPFTVEPGGSIYSACTTDSDPTAAWCATQSSITEPVASSTAGWGYCDCTYTIASDEETSFWVDLTNPTSVRSPVTPSVVVSGSIAVGSVSMTDGDGSGAAVLGPTQGTPALDLTRGQAYSSVDGVGWPAWLEQMTVEMWVLVAPGSSAKTLISIGGSGLRVSVLDGGAGTTTVSVKGEEQLFSGVGIDDGAWHHLAVSWSGAAGEVSVWVDGAVVQSVAGVQAGEALELSAANLTLGASSNAAGDDLLLAEVRVWSTARAASAAVPSIVQTFDAFLSAAPRPASLLALYAFDPAVGVAADGSVYGRPLNISAGDVEDVDSGDLALEGFVYPVPTLTTKLAASSVAYPGGDACVSIALQSDVDLGPGAEVIIGGLQGLQPLPPAVPVGSDSASQGAWDAGSSALTVPLTAPVLAGAWLNLSFTVVLPLGNSAPRSLAVQVRDGSSLSYGDEAEAVGKATLQGAVLASSPLDSADRCPVPASTPVPHWQGSTCPEVYGCPEASLAGQAACGCASLCPSGAWKRPRGVMSSAADPWVNTLSVQGSTDAAGVHNQIQVAMQPDRAIPAGSNITVSGLVNSLTEDRTAGPACATTGACFLALAGAGADKFELFSGVWLQGSGTLILTLAQALTPDGQTRFSFTIQNPSEQQHVYPTVEVSGPVPIPPVAACDGVEVAASAAVFTSASVHESTCTPCQSNLLTFTLRASVALTVNTSITVSGLDGTLSPTATVPLQGPDAYLFEDGLGHWTGDPAGALVTSLGVGVAASESFVLSFGVHNNRQPQTPRSPRISARVPQYHAPGAPPPPAVRVSGSVLSFAAAAEHNSSTSAQWVPTGWEGYYGGEVEWIEGASGVCCAGECCPRKACCGCEALLGSGLQHLRATGLYFRGSPCEVYCDMATDGGGWTLLASVSGADASRWLPRANASDPADLQHYPNVPPLFEALHYTVGSGPPDPMRDADFRSWAFFEATGDGRGTGDQVLITFGNASTTAPVPLLQTEGGCLGELPMAERVAGLEWNCSRNRSGALVDFEREEASEERPVPGPAACSNACAIVENAAWAAWGGEGALLGGAKRAYLLLKAGSAGGPEAAGAEDGGDFAWLSTELRDEEGRGRGLGALCSGAGCGGAEGEGADIGGGEEGGAGVWYSVWARREGWAGECAAPLQREGERCECCWCEAGFAGDGAKCAPCGPGRYKHTPGTGGCAVCGGTENLGEGRSSCPHTVEVWVETARREAGGGSAEGASVPWVSVLFAESSAWSQRIYLSPGPRAPDDLLDTASAGVPGLKENATARVLAGGLGEVGTPVAVRYGMAERANSDVWQPRRLAVRPNGGRWFAPNATLVAVNAVCREGGSCHAGAAQAELPLEALPDDA